jgi:hypothetical protein
LRLSTTAWPEALVTTLMLVKTRRPSRLTLRSFSSTERLAVPPMWNVRIVSWVPGSPIDWAAMMPTASPRSASMPRARSMP